MTEKTLSGTCLCGAVRYEVAPPFDFFGFCQCSRCRQVTGAAFATNLFAPTDQFSWICGADNIGHFDLPEAKSFANAFCRICGSRVPRKLKTTDRMLIPAGSIMEDPGIEPTLVCAEDHTEWFTGLERAVSGGTR